MYFRFIILLIFISSKIFINAQNNPTLFSVDNRKVSLNEFRLAFEDRYGKDKSSDKQLVNDFLQERISFTLQVEEAKDLRLNTDKAIQKKISDFKKMIIESHINDENVLDKLTKEAYQRMQTEIELMHVLFRVSKFAEPKDTLLAYKKAMAVRDLIVSGKNFNELIKQVSDVPFSTTMAGYQGYVDVFSLPYSVENYIYTKNPKSWSHPIRSHQGYHLVKILSKRKNPGHFKVSHILIKNNNDSNQTEVKEAKKKIDDIYKKYLNGENFNALAEKYSDDVSSFQKSSPLTWLSTKMMPLEFEKRCFKLNNGEVSEPFKTRFGWHIIKKIDQQNLPKYEVVKEQLEQMIMADNRGNIIKNSIIKKLKKKYKFKDYQALTPIIKMVNDSIFEAKWIAKGCEVFTGKLCEIYRKTYYQKNFIKYLQDNQEERFPIPIKTYVHIRYNNFVNNILLDCETRNLEKNNIEISKALKRYEDLILVSALSEKKYNSKSEINDAVLENYYNMNKEKYNQTYQVDMSMFSYTNNVKKIEKLFRKLKSKGASDKEVVARIKASKDMLFKIDKRILAKEGENMYVNHIVKLFKNGKLGFDDKLIIFANEKKIVWLNSHITKTNQTLEQVRAAVINDYKKHNYGTWIDKLKNKHNLVINEDALNRL